MPNTVMTGISLGTSSRLESVKVKWSFLEGLVVIEQRIMV